MRTEEEIKNKINHFIELIKLDNNYLQKKDIDVLEMESVENHTYLQQCKIAILEWVLETENISYDLPKRNKND